jgi:hypothetical protein
MRELFGLLNDLYTNMTGIHTLRFDKVTPELANKLKTAFCKTLERNMKKFDEDTKKYGYRPEKITTLHDY